MVGFRPDAQDPVTSLVRVFGIDAQVAEQIANSLPCIVKRGVSGEAQARVQSALVEVGALVELRPAGAAPSFAPAPKARPPKPANRPISLPSIALPATNDSLRNDSLLDTWDSPESAMPLPEIAEVERPKPRRYQSSRPPSGNTPSSRPPGVGDARGTSSYAAVPESLRPPESAPPPVRERYAAVAIILGGVAVFVVGLLLGKSAFLGTGNILHLALEASALGSMIFGLLRLLNVPFLRERVGVPGVLLVTLSFVGLVVVNFAVKSLSTEEVIETGPVRIEARTYLNDAASLIEGVEKDRVRQLVNAAYGAGASEVYVLDPVTIGGTRFASELTVMLPTNPIGRDRIQRAYRRYLGERIGEFDAADLQPPPGREWNIWVGE